MSASRELQDYLKSLPSISDLTGLLALVFDSAGGQSKVDASILGINFRVVNAAGASLARAGLNLILAIDADNPEKVLLYTAYREAGQAPVRTEIFAKGLYFGACNNQGTMVVAGGTNIKQYRLSFV